MSAEEIKKVKDSIRLNEWAMLVNEQQESGLSATAWCKLNNIKPSTFFSRLRRVREITLQNSSILKNNSLPVANTSFAEIDITNMQHMHMNDFKDEVTTNITVTLNGASIEIPNTVPILFITSILEVVKEL